MDILDRIEDIYMDDINTFTNINKDKSIYIEINNAKEFLKFIEKLEQVEVIKDMLEERISGIYPITEDINASSIVYPLYVKLEKYIDKLAIVVIDNREICKIIKEEDMYIKYNNKDILNKR